ncbi:hypothetical protein GCM10018779_63720 [Streptomyces griseocarneus]|nr:hypothetical protein GCM10018779_63720 [Streptomyces griseocarneus]
MDRRNRYGLWAAVTPAGHEVFHNRTVVHRPGRGPGKAGIVRSAENELAFLTKGGGPACLLPLPLSRPRGRPRAAGCRSSLRCARAGGAAAIAGGRRQRRPG